MDRPCTAFAAGELPWMNIDALHRLILDDLLKSHQVSGLSEADTQELNRVWHRLNPWPDVASGLARLRRTRHRGCAVQWQCGLAGQHGPARRTMLGLCALRRTGQTLQAGPRGVPDCGRAIGVGASPSNDGCRPQRRPVGRAGCRFQDRICPPASGAWAQPDHRSRSRSLNRRRGRKFQRSSRSPWNSMKEMPFERRKNRSVRQRQPNERPRSSPHCPTGDWSVEAWQDRFPTYGARLSGVSRRYQNARTVPSSNLPGCCIGLADG